MKEEGEASQLLKNFCLMVNIQFGVKVKVIRTTNGSEFIARPMKHFYSEQGMTHQTNCVCR